MQALVLLALLLTGSDVSRFSGEWVLDAGGSKRLPQSVRELQSLKMTVKAEEGNFYVQTRIRNDEGETAEDRQYALDGSKRDVSTNDMPATLAIKQQTNGDLQLRMTRTIPAGGSTTTEVTTETWKLNKDGSLSVRYHRETSFAATDYEMRFVRAKSE